MLEKNRRAEELPMSTIVLIIIILITIAVVIIFAFGSFSSSTAQTGNFTFIGQNASKIAEKNVTDLLK
jgi:uncharacterized ion transporter superfamily protein YfcC